MMNPLQMGYPETLDEFETLDRLLAGQGCVRYGDGCFKVMRGQHDIFQAADPFLARRLAEILAAKPPDNLLVCLPRINDLPHGTPAYRHWQIFLESDAGIIPFLPKGRTWGSSFISRADSAPWCHTLEFYERFSRLWGGKDITYVASGSRSLTVSGLQASPHPPASVKYVEAPARQAWSQYARIKAECGKPQTVVMACGQVARVLGYELALAGTQVIDIGHFGIFFGLTALHEIGKYQWIHGQPIRQP